MSALLIRFLLFPLFPPRSGRGPSGADAATCAHKAALGSVLNDRLILRNYHRARARAGSAAVRATPEWAPGRRGKGPSARRLCDTLGPVFSEAMAGWLTRCYAQHAGGAVGARCCTISLHRTDRCPPLSLLRERKGTRMRNMCRVSVVVASSVPFEQLSGHGRDRFHSIALILSSHI